MPKRIAEQSGNIKKKEVTEYQRQLGRGVFGLDM